MLLYGFYRLTVSRDTFFGLRRLTLWLIYAVALMVPALNLEYWVRDTPTMASMANVYADTFYPVVVVKAQAPSITWMDMLLGIYWAGVAVLSLRLVWQLFSIIRLAAISRKQEVEGITVHLLSGDGMRREPMPVKEACVSPCSGCNMSTAFHPRHAKDSEWTSHSATSSNWP